MTPNGRGEVRGSRKGGGEPSDDVEDNIIYTESRRWVDPTYALRCVQYITVPWARLKG